MNRNGLNIGFWVLIFGLVIGGAISLLDEDLVQGSLFSAVAIALALLVCRSSPEKSLRP